MGQVWSRSYHLLTPTVSLSFQTKQDLCTCFTHCLSISLNPSAFLPHSSCKLLTLDQSKIPLFCGMSYTVECYQGKKSITWTGTTTNLHWTSSSISNNPVCPYSPLALTATASTSHFHHPHKMHLLQLTNGQTSSSTV